MKYANFLSTTYESGIETTLCNLGDYAVIQALENLYHFMGIHEDEKVYIELDDLKSYDGEYAILPINMIMWSQFFSKNNVFHISPKLFPVFLGATLEEEKWSHISGTFEFFKAHEPIGCRDDVALAVMQKHGISSYLGGCLSLALPRRDCSIRGDMTYLVDIPKRLLNYMPGYIKENAKVVTHHVCMEKSIYSRECYTNLAKRQYLEYKLRAKLVVTSRLHAALPCLAMGIPVILVRDYGAFTFSWIEKLTPFYTRKDYDKIDWNPQPVEFEELKQKLLLNASTRVRAEYEKHQHMCEISEFYESRQPRYRTYTECQNIYLQDLFNHLSHNWDKNACIRYALWGVQSNAEEIYQHIRENYPKAELVKVFDSWVDFDFHGIHTSHPKEMTSEDDYYTIVVATNAVHAAQDFFREIGKPKSQYYFVADTFVKPGDLL